MAATITIRVYTGSNAATQSSAVSGIDFISADNATNSLANRQANPIPAGGRSYEKWIKAYVDAAPDNMVENLQLWGDGTVDTNTDLYVGTTATGATPTNNDSTVATDDFTDYTSGSKLTWDDTSELDDVGDTSKYAVFQLDVGASADPGNWTDETIYYSYDET